MQHREVGELAPRPPFVKYFLLKLERQPAKHLRRGVPLAGIPLWFSHPKRNGPKLAPRAAGGACFTVKHAPSRHNKCNRRLRRVPDSLAMANGMTLVGAGPAPVTDVQGLDLDNLSTAQVRGSVAPCLATPRSSQATSRRGSGPSSRPASRWWLLASRAASTATSATRPTSVPWGWQPRRRWAWRWRRPRSGTPPGARRLPRARAVSAPRCSTSSCGAQWRTGKVGEGRAACPRTSTSNKAAPSGPSRRTWTRTSRALRP